MGEEINPLCRTLFLDTENAPNIGDGQVVA